MTELRRLVSDKREQEGAMIQVCICNLFISQINQFSSIAIQCMVILRPLEIYEGLDANGART